MAFHWRDNRYFERMEDGSVRIYITEGPGMGELEIALIPPNEWVSIIASVSGLEKDITLAYSIAHRLHDKLP